MWWRGWDGEVGSEEEVEFLVVVVVEEMVGLEMEGLDFVIWLYVVLGVMWVVVVDEVEREVLLKEMERRMVEMGRIGEDRVGKWLIEVLLVVELYVKVW